MVTLLCTVRGCGEALASAGRGLTCPRGHAFDRARSGYVNLLQPNDRRSKRPGDSKAAVDARRRFLDAGHEERILRALLDAAEEAGLAAGSAVLDVGCGEGTFLSRLGGETGADTCGLDISVAAVDAAARSHPGATWVVANADRFLPFPDESFALASSITSRRNAHELARVIAPYGLLVVAVPAPDDLVELREALHGRRVERSRVERTVAELTPAFALRRHVSARSFARLDETAIRDLLTSTYRGERRGERERLAEVRSLDVTLARDVLLFARA